MLFNKKNNFKSIKFFSKFLIIILLINTSLETNSLRASTYTCDSANKPKTCNLSTLYKLVSPLFKDIKPTLSDFKSDYCKYINHQNPANLDTVLMSAAATGQLDTINALIGCNANPDFKNHKDYTALDFAKSKLSSNPKTYQPILDNLKQVTTCRTDVTSDNSCLPGFNNIDCCTGYTCDPTSKTCKSNTPVGPTCAKSGESCATLDCCDKTQNCQDNGSGIKTCITPVNPPSVSCCKALGKTCDPSNTSCDRTKFTCDPDTNKCKATPVTPLPCCIGVGDNCDPDNTTCDKTSFICDQSTKKCKATPVTPPAISCCSKVGNTCNPSDTNCDTSQFTCNKDTSKCENTPPNGGIAINSSGLSGEEVTGIVIGIVVVVGLGIVITLWRRNRNKKLELLSRQKIEGGEADRLIRQASTLMRTRTGDDMTPETLLKILRTNESSAFRFDAQVNVLRILLTKTNNDSLRGHISSTSQVILSAILEEAPGRITFTGTTDDPTDIRLVVSSWESPAGEHGGVAKETQLEITKATLDQVATNWAEVVRAGKPQGEEGSVKIQYADRMHNIPIGTGQVYANSQSQAEQRFIVREYLTTGWRPEGIGPRETFTSWKDFVDKYPAQARDLYALVSYQEQAYEPSGRDAEIMRTILDVFSENGLLTGRVDSASFWKDGVSGTGGRIIPLLDAKEINMPSHDRDAALRAFNNVDNRNPEFVKFRRRALDLIGFRYDISTASEQERIDAFIAFTQVQEAIKQSGALPEYVEPE